ncbi:hypothetical protein QTP70_009362, partial [Hemibagrus guttatus]
TERISVLDPTAHLQNGGVQVSESELCDATWEVVMLWLTAVMVRITALNDLEDLGGSTFNQPPPRHGLRLLYWFVCANRNNQLDPTQNTYGFHKFFNWIDDDEDKLLPNSQNLPYYEVGNLNAKGADKLPKYVRPHNSFYYGEHNKDRIIVRLRQGRIDKVYVTEHEDQKAFNHERTYRVSQHLLNQISNMEKERFIQHMQQRRQFTNQSGYTPSAHQQAHQGSNDDSWCTIL